MAEAPQAEILDRLDADAGWTAAKLAEQRENEVRLRFRLLSEKSRENQPLLAALTKITRVLKEGIPPQIALNQIQQALDDGYAESKRVHDKIHGVTEPDENQVIL